MTLLEQRRLSSCDKEEMELLHNYDALMLYLCHKNH